MQHLMLVYSAPRPAHRENGFNSRDLMSLNEWNGRSDAHGYRRVIIEEGSDQGGPEEGAYVLLYTSDAEWARWGIARGSSGIMIWHCGTGADLGRFETMLEALESLPPVCPTYARPRTQPPTPTPRFSLVHSA